MALAAAGSQSELVESAACRADEHAHSLSASGGRLRLVRLAACLPGVRRILCLGAWTVCAPLASVHGACPSPSEIDMSRTCAAGLPGRAEHACGHPIGLPGAPGVRAARAAAGAHAHNYRAHGGVRPDRARLPLSRRYSSALCQLPQYRAHVGSCSCFGLCSSFMANWYCMLHALCLSRRWALAFLCCAFLSGTWQCPRQRLRQCMVAPKNLPVALRAVHFITQPLHIVLVDHDHSHRGCNGGPVALSCLLCHG